jgi:hypothetical protein
MLMWPPTTVRHKVNAQMEALMRRSGVILLALVLSAGLTATGTAFAKSKHKGGSKGAAPPSAELNKLKAIKLGDPKAGVFSWGMSPDEVFEKVKGALEARYQKAIDESRADPGKQQRIRDERAKEIAAVKKSLTNFDGQKSGWDVSIIGPEFMQNNGEAVLQAKEEIWTRYFFFFEGHLYKMFLAFNKDTIGNKSFRDFGKEMAAKYGAPREVYRDEKEHGGVKRVLDHYEWAVSGGDQLKLVDRSEFYGVFCLVLQDARMAEQVAEKRKVTNPGNVEKDALVEAVVNAKESAQDSNDDIIDRVTGHQIKRPGDEEKHGDIVVPMPNAPSPSDVNGPSEKSSKKGKKEEKKASGSGLEL